MINTLFPFKHYLHILQLEEYKINRFLIWVLQNPTKRSSQSKKPLVWTQKAKKLYKLSLIFFIVSSVILIYFFKILGVLLSFILLTQPYLFLSLAVVYIIPVEKINRVRVKNFMRNKVANLKKDGLTVIGITGSYGKTTTKEFLYTILSAKYNVLKTPGSYNTLFGIYKVVDLELTKGYDFFICEMGAYFRGEIKELCDVLLPDHAILTGINEQHIDRFKNIQNTIKAKFELIEAVNSKGICVINGENENIMQNYKNFVKEPIIYGSKNNEFGYSNIKYKNGLLSVTFVIDSKEIHLENISIFGVGNISNLLAAATLASKLGMSHSEIKDAISKIKPVEHRLQVINQTNKIIIDDSYSSNVTGFYTALDFLNTFDSHTKILVTPGIVELGNKTGEIHKKLGEYADKICDFVILVGSSERTKSLSEKINEDKIIFIESINLLNQKLDSLNVSSPVVLIENDLPDNY